MAGHSQFKNIMYRKGAQDKKRGKIFARLACDIQAAIKAGSDDPCSNPALRSAIMSARRENMPKENIERAIRNGFCGGDNVSWQNVCYEGYGPGGVALIIDALTDNRNRTASEMRAAFSKFGGKLGETNSVSFMFNRVGRIVYPADIGSANDVLEAAINAGAENTESSQVSHEIACHVEEFNIVLELLQSTFGKPQSAGLAWKPLNKLAVDDEHVVALIKLWKLLKSNNHVQQLAANFDTTLIV
ncbi:YebC/PmpR family DNA-binding transcriptional regulator [Candidatus Endolissoclinum faulkneri]|nr:YebC/PmpR family DNA-binding transcriptional regulator [Candidatus Endolissoclinum faulkneri]